MWPHNKPGVTSREVFLASIAHAEVGRREVLLKALEDVCQAEADYDAKPDPESLYGFPKVLKVGEADKDALVDVYRRMRDERYAGRQYYDQLRTSASLCLHCNRGDVEELDHYLAKAEYPLLAVMPINLVPACSRCNSRRNEKRPTCAEEMSLHPYYDDIDSDDWLTATFDEDEPAVVFFVSPSDSWSDLLSRRVSNQFEALLLGERYASDAGTEISGMAGALEKRLQEGGETNVAVFLKDIWESQRANQRNAWRTALYAAAWRSAWFCQGGFRELTR